MIGVIPDLLQDLLLQVYAGFHVASELDQAVTAFRANGIWPASLLQLPAGAHNHVTNQVDAMNHAQQSVEPPANQPPPPPVARAVTRLCPTHLHQHPCEQRTSAVWMMAGPGRDAQVSRPVLQTTSLIETQLLITGACS